jgi:hypothetical protein
MPASAGVWRPWLCCAPLTAEGHRLVWGVPYRAPGDPGLDHPGVWLERVAVADGQVGGVSGGEAIGIG